MSIEYRANGTTTCGTCGDVLPGVAVLTQGR